ncbi:protein IQ-DOMAIN 33 [Impatiens glandulifera]|uniref:protein IQ-DOMAIN 33 n=1 Tax=Impatiens glandulifera TaxID=253017 RepID=UPI001FB0DBE9|nr:protein IQ-DOMAIN 33 [Impatiens glandulifera]
MGLIKGELVRNVFFSKNKSINRINHDQAQERKKWSKMRSYLCGDEFNSVLAEHDSDSFRSFSAVISSQPPHQNSSEDHGEEEEESAMIMKSTTENSEFSITQQPISVVEKQRSTADLFREEDAAITIQSAFRNFQARHRSKEMIETEESIGTSLEVQTGNSIVQEKLTKKLQQKARTGSSSLKLKEDWDDSTVSSNISKMRIQNRVEAMTRRERALAYAFSQQLRICSKKKEAETSTDMAWSWLERWMATRLPENNNNNSTVESHNGNKDQSFIMKKRLLDIGVEEKESCGSNEVSSTLQIESIITKNRVKQTRTVSRKKVNKKED